MKYKSKRKLVNYKKRILIFSIFIVFIFLSVGYTYLYTNLSINGTATVLATNYDVHFENLSITQGSVTAITPASIQNNRTKVNYSVQLEHPGDYYEFSVDIVNDGSLSGRISSTTIEGISSSSEAYINSSIKYNNGVDVQVGDLLNPGTRKRIKVRISYKNNLNGLPEQSIGLNIKYSIDYINAIQLEPDLNDLIQNLYAESNSCISKYEGQVTDQVGQTVNATNVYFDKCENKRNVIFGDYCWQVIRTTETGGIKILYNGEPVNGKCESTRSDHPGIVATSNFSTFMREEIVYGTNFTYDANTNTFTLVDTQLNTWGDTTANDLIGKYTCGNQTNTCTDTLYNINEYVSNDNGFINIFKIQNINYAQIAHASYNAYEETPAKVGYMFNKVYYPDSKNPGSTRYKYGNSFTYNESTGTYELSGTTRTVNNWANNLNTLSNTHYTCWNTTGTCQSISYIFYADSSSASYINLTNGESASDALNNMLYNNVNNYNSDAKGIVDSWFRDKLLRYSNLLESPVYCNDRTISQYSGWNPNTTAVNSSMTFRNSSTLDCPNVTDQLSVDNNNAKLTYPVALLTGPEERIINNANLFNTNSIWWTLTPFAFCNHKSASNKIINAYGNPDDEHTATQFGIRPVITLKGTNVISSGSGTETDPWIIFY